MPENVSSAAPEQTEVGSYFVANYPPFSVWTQQAVGRDARPALASPPAPGVPLGLYLHIPFCRKRCHFCYFRVYTDKNAKDVAALPRRARRASGAATRHSRRSPAGRSTSSTSAAARRRSSRPSSSTSLVDRLTARSAVDAARRRSRSSASPARSPAASSRRSATSGVTRLSLGVENFDDRILEINGRAHRSAEIFRAYGKARALGFPQVNIDLIAGMLGETEDELAATACASTLELAPDSVTIYQMELPFNTTISRDLLRGTHQFDEPVADWATKRRWVDEAFEALEAAGYTSAAPTPR